VINKRMKLNKNLQKKN